MRHARFVVLVFALLLSFGSPNSVFAEDQKPIISPAVKLLKALAPDLPRHVPSGIVNVESVLVSLRFKHELAVEQLKDLETLGVEFSYDRAGNYESVHRIGSIYPARIPWRAFKIVAGFPGLQQVDTEYLRHPIRPLDVTRPLTHSDILAEHIEFNHGSKPGEGIRIADIDSGIDTLHPAFFHADGVYYPWLDVNKNGRFDFETDVIDIDGDSQPSVGETTRYVDVALINFYDQEHGMDTIQGNGQFDVGVDWVYIDSNNNENRDAGKDAGFSDQTPGFAEPTFLLDDVNRNGSIDLDEKFVMLRTSKFEKVRVSGKDYVRGDNLSAISVQTFGGLDASGRPAALHGTGVSGILAGNTPGLSRFVGMAPYATLFLLDNSMDYGSGGTMDASTVEKLIWARDEDVDILLYEFSMWAMTFMDGSSNLEKAMDELFEDDGILHVAPAGNLATSGKHMERELPPGATEIGISIPEHWPQYDYYPFETPAYIFTLYYPGEVGDITIQVKGPNQQSFTKIELGQDEPVAFGNGMLGLCYGEKSAAQFTMLMCYVYDQSQVAVDYGTWIWEATNVSDSPIYVHGYIMDWVSSWGRAPTFTEFESDDTTICHPSTADSAISVAAYGGRFGTLDELGVLRDYSSRGPRMDGYTAIDITAPDDPYAPLPEWDLSARMPGAGTVTGSYMVFGGTSGAGPHVAGSVALLKQALPDASAPELVKALYDGAETGDFMGTLPNKDYGHGKLNIWNAATGTELPGENEAPEAVPGLVQRTGLYCYLDASASSDPEGDPLEYRWDLNYDGKWDTSWSDSSTIEYGFAEPTRAVMKLAVRDSQGKQDETLLAFDVDEETFPPVDQVAEPETPDIVEDTDQISDLIDVDNKQAHDSEPKVPDSDEVTPAKSGDGCTTGSEPTSMLPMVVFLLVLFAVRFRRRTSRSSHPVCL